MPAPVPAAVTPHEALYHLQFAPVPKEPPFTVNTVDSPKQIVLMPVIELAGKEVSLTVSVNETQLVVLHPPSALR
jgi:hypothetical protein